MSDVFSNGSGVPAKSSFSKHLPREDNNQNTRIHWEDSVRSKQPQMNRSSSRNSNTSSLSQPRNGKLSLITSNSSNRVPLINKSMHKRNSSKSGTVATLNPTLAVALNESATVYEAAAYMAAKRQDAVLITNSDNQLIGIITDKDITYRVIANGLDPNFTPVSEAMTSNPVSVTAQSSATEALDKMVAGHFRHLPVIESDDEGSDGRGSPLDADSGSGGGGVVGVLDVTKCLYDALAKLDKVYESADAALSSPRLASTKKNDAVSFESPSLAGMLAEQSEAPPVIGIFATVYDAAKLMKETMETAVLVFDNNGSPDGTGELAGIFTTKDLVLRVVAAGSKASDTLVSRVMTPHPECVSPDTPALDALQKMYAGKYLHLPVVDDSGVILGMVDVLKLTYTTLDQLSSMKMKSGSVWNKFWDPTVTSTDSLNTQEDEQLSPQTSSPSASEKYLPDSDRFSEGSERRSRKSDKARSSVSSIPASNLPSAHFSKLDTESLAPEDSASMFGMKRRPTFRKASLGSNNSQGNNNTLQPPSQQLQRPIFEHRRSLPQSFVFKVKDEDTLKVHRITAPISNLRDLVDIISARIGWNRPPHPSVTYLEPDGERLELSYVDDEGDFVHLSTTTDLMEAVEMARGLGWQRLILSIDIQRERRLTLSAISGASKMLNGLRQEELTDSGWSDTGSMGTVTLAKQNVLRNRWMGGSAYEPLRRSNSSLSRRSGGGGGSDRRDEEVYTREKEENIAPVLVGAGVAVVCAFLIGRMFKI
ncbi:hypothetical protein HK098_002136 [Nowakowskiella sp. JEL0407]|nr:hypothetical protein HK098_002136 [Nowakowskiella sp. JEL0407]